MITLSDLTPEWSVIATMPPMGEWDYRISRADLRALRLARDTNAILTIQRKREDGTTELLAAAVPARLRGGMP